MKDEMPLTTPDTDGEFEGDVWFGHPEKRTLGTHIWRAGAWHELPTELDAVISLLGLARRQRDAAIEGLILAKSALERGTHQDFQDETFADISTILESLKLPFSKPAPDLARCAASADKLVEALEKAADGFRSIRDDRYLDSKTHRAKVELRSILEALATHRSLPLR
jgi:hypothetical protein